MSSEIINILIGIAALIFFTHVLVLALLETKRSEGTRAKLEHVQDRIEAWWVILIVLALAFYFNKGGICVLFVFVSFFALREYITLSPTTSSDHRSMFWMFFLILPLQYFAIYRGWITLFNYLIPAFALIVLPFRSSLSRETNKFLERTSSLQWGLMISVYCVSYVPAILLVEIPGFNRQAELLLFFTFITQINDVIQHETDLWLGKHKIAPEVTRLKSWEGWVTATVVMALLGWAIHPFTPFTLGQSLFLTLLCTQLGFAGSLVMSAIKRSRGIQTFDELIPGHGGILDRIDTILFAAPVFYHIIKNLSLLPKFTH